MKERKLGETFKYGDVLLKVEVSGYLCSDCYFKRKNCYNVVERGSCMHQLRSDRKNVIFVEQKTQ